MFLSQILMKSNLSNHAFIYFYYRSEHPSEVCLECVSLEGLGQRCPGVHQETEKLAAVVTAIGTFNNIQVTLLHISWTNNGLDLSSQLQTDSNNHWTTVTTRSPRWIQCWTCCCRKCCSTHSTCWIFSDRNY